jgi:spermidine export protein MdtI
MLPTFVPVHLFYLAIAIVFEMIANYLLKLSNGFTQKLPAVAAICFVLAAFTALSLAIEGIQLSIAYSIWGGIGVIATAVIGIIRFGERLRPSAWIGMALVIIGMVLIQI